MYLIGEEYVAVIFSKLIGFFLVKQWHSSNVSLFHCSDWSQAVSQSQSQRERCDQEEYDGGWEGVFLLSITPSVPPALPSDTLLAFRPPRAIQIERTGDESVHGFVIFTVI